MRAGSVPQGDSIWSPRHEGVASRAEHYPPVLVRNDRGVPVDCGLAPLPVPQGDSAVTVRRWVAVLALATAQAQHRAHPSEESALRLYAAEVTVEEAGAC